jgi:hypothetical protein
MAWRSIDLRALLPELITTEYVKVLTTSTRCTNEYGDFYCFARLQNASFVARVLERNFH